jgi:hypothetical protein
MYSGEPQGNHIQPSELRKKIARLQERLIKAPIDSLAALAKKKILRSIPEGMMEDEHFEREVFFDKLVQVRDQFVQQVNLFEHEDNIDLQNLIEAKRGETMWGIFQDILFPADAESQAFTPQRLEEIDKACVDAIQTGNSESLGANRKNRLAIHNSRILVSLLNQEICYWRRYCELNLRPTQEKSQTATDVNGIIYDAAIVEPHAQQASGERMKKDQFQDCLVEAFLEISRYENHTFQTETDTDLFNKSIKRKSNTLSTSYNRSRQYTCKDDKIIATEYVVPIHRVAVQNYNSGKNISYFTEQNLPSHPDQANPNPDKRPFSISYIVDHAGQMMTGNEAISSYLSESHGDIKKMKKKLIENNYIYGKKELEERISYVASSPLIIIQDKHVQEATNSQELQLYLTQLANERKKEQPYLPFVITAGIAQDGSLGLAISRNHDIGDGAEANELLEKLYRRLREKLGIADQTPVLTEKDVKIDRIVPPQEDLSTKEGNIPIQAYVRATKLYVLSKSISEQVRKLSETHPELAVSKLKSPSFVLQLMIARAYRELYAKAQGDPLFAQEVGILLGNKSLTKDLDLIPITDGFDIGHYLTLVGDKSTSDYILSVIEKTQQAQDDSSMNLIKKVSNHVPSHWAQSKLNWISRLPATAWGLRLLTGELMLSGFRLPKELGEMKPWIETAGPALTQQQYLALTLCGAFRYKESNSDKEEFILSLRVKGKKNSVAYTFISALKKWIEEEQYLGLQEATNPKKFVLPTFEPVRE